MNKIVFPILDLSAIGIERDLINEISTETVYNKFALVNWKMIVKKSVPKK